MVFTKTTMTGKVSHGSGDEMSLKPPSEFLEGWPGDESFEREYRKSQRRQEFLQKSSGVLPIDCKTAEAAKCAAGGIKITHEKIRLQMKKRNGRKKFKLDRMYDELVKKQKLESHCTDEIKIRDDGSVRICLGDISISEGRVGVLVTLMKPEELSKWISRKPVEPTEKFEPCRGYYEAFKNSVTDESISPKKRNDMESKSQSVFKRTKSTETEKLSPEKANFFHSVSDKDKTGYTSDSNEQAISKIVNDMDDEIPKSQNQFDSEPESDVVEEEYNGLRDDMESNVKEVTVKMDTCRERLSTSTQFVIDNDMNQSKKAQIEKSEKEKQNSFDDALGECKYDSQLLSEETSSVSDTKQADIVVDYDEDVLQLDIDCNEFEF